MKFCDNKEYISICREFSDNAPAEVIIQEPYLPYIPEKWNGVLVLAEAQNLSKKADQYINKLKNSTSEDRIKRLYLHDDGLGIQPWDDGTLKLALKAMVRDIDIREVAVSNSVPWSCVNEKRNNKNPTSEMTQKANEFWKALFDLWNPDIKLIVVLGNIADQVIKGTTRAEVFRLRLPSPNYIQRISGMFSDKDLLARHPEVGEAKEYLEKEYPKIMPKPWQVFYACHAVSLGKEKFENLLKCS